MWLVLDNYQKPNINTEEEETNDQIEAAKRFSINLIVNEPKSSYSKHKT